jgi:GntR family transcriptional regulator/MocR family aminotransferase
MSRARSGRILGIMLNRGTGVPLHRQIYTDVRNSILAARLKPGAALPSTRALASDLRVSRSTIVLAYEQLRAEGYLISKIGGGTRVAQTIPDSLVTKTRAAESREPPRTVVTPPLHAAALRYALFAEPRAPRAFRSGVPALDAFPITKWTRAVNAALRRMPARQLSYGGTFGLKELREAIADYLTNARGVRCTADHIMVVNGSQQALALCAAVLIERGTPVWLEDPFYPGARGVFELAGARIVDVSVDENGLNVAEGRQKAPDAKLAFVTPSRQLPLGVTMSLERRLELLEWAREANAWIIEDDYDSEFRFTSAPLTALQGLSNGSVIYTGTFSKVMFPAMRLGYMVVPDALHDLFQIARHFNDMHTSYLEQAAMARFMAEGHFERHVRRMRILYRDRQQILIDAATQHLGDRVRILPPDAGMTLIAWLRQIDDDAAIAQAICEAGVDVTPVSTLSAQHRIPPGLLLGYSGVRPSEIREGITVLAEALQRYDARTVNR